jgi:hypothetical protein
MGDGMKVSWPDMLHLLAVFAGALLGGWWARMQRQSARARELAAAWASLEEHAAAVVQAVKQIEPADARDASGKLKQGTAAHLLGTAMDWLKARAAPELAVLRSHGIDLGAVLRTIVETAVADAKASAPTDWADVVTKAVLTALPFLPSGAATASGPLAAAFSAPAAGAPVAPPPLSPSPAIVAPAAPSGAQGGA